MLRLTRHAVAQYTVRVRAVGPPAARQELEYLATRAVKLANPPQWATLGNNRADVWAAAAHVLLFVLDGTVVTVLTPDSCRGAPKGWVTSARPPLGAILAGLGVLVHPHPGQTAAEHIETGLTRDRAIAATRRHVRKLQTQITAIDEENLTMGTYRSKRRALLERRAKLTRELTTYERKLRTLTTKAIPERAAA